MNIRSPEQIVDGILTLMRTETGEGFRGIFLRDFTLERHLTGLAEAAAPAVLTVLLVQRGRPGEWAALGAVFLAAGLVVPALTR